MSNSTATAYKAPALLPEAKELLGLLTCGQPTGYHVREAYACHRAGSYEVIRSSLATGQWLPARFVRPRQVGEPELPRFVEEPRILSAHTVAKHLEGRGWIGTAPPSWVDWFAFDIDLPKAGPNGQPLELDAAERQRDDTLASVWRAFDFGPDRLPVLLRTPSGGYHLYVPLSRKDGERGHTWPAHVIRERVQARLTAVGLKLRDGHLELWPSGKILRFPMGRKMCLLHAQNPGDPDYLGLVPVHASWQWRTDPRTKERERVLRRNVADGVRAFLDEFRAARRPLEDWLYDEGANWSETYGPFSDTPPSDREKNRSLTDRKRDVSQQYEEGMGDPEGYLLRGEFYQRRISKLLRTGLTVPGGRHDAALKLTYYFGVGLGLNEARSMNALGEWLREHPHVSNFLQTKGMEAFVKQTLREARHYYRTVVARVGGGRRGQLPLGLPLGQEELEALEGRFSSEPVEEAALCVLRFLKGYADSGGRIGDPVELSSRLLLKLCGERRVAVIDDEGHKRRVRATQLALTELCEMGILSLYKNYRVDHHGRFFCCWYRFGSGVLPTKSEDGQVELGRGRAPEGELVLCSQGEGLSRPEVHLEKGPNDPDIPAWVERAYLHHNFSPQDLENAGEHLGSFRDYRRVFDEPAPEDPEATREFGTVIEFAADAGFGFVRPDTLSRDVFVHQTSICMDGFRDLRPGDRVSYTRVHAPKGPKALWLRLEEKDSRPPPLAPANENVHRVENAPPR